jgi:hypothetical protein
VAFAGHSMAATSIFTPPVAESVFVMSNSFMLGGIVTRVPEKRKRKKGK